MKAMKIIIPNLILALLLPCFGFSQNIEGYLLVTLGEDTIGIEHFQIEGDDISIEVIRRVKTVIREEVRMVYRTDGSVKIVESSRFNPSDSLIWQSKMISKGDSLYHEMTRNGKINRWVRSGRPHLLAAQVPYFVTYTKFIQAYERAPETDFRFSFNNVPTRVEKAGENQYEITNEIFRTVRVKANAQKELLVLETKGTSLLSYEARKVERQVYEALKYRWLNNPGVATISTVSPRIKETFSVQEMEIKVDYSSTSKRGRQIFGGVVPFNKIWRTGSDRATHIEFSQDLLFDGKLIPKGQYTLYTFPKEDHWLFLLNKQTGQWGTRYDEQQEILRLPMQTRHVQAVQEALRIEVEETSGGGSIIIRWDQVEAAIAFELLGGALYKENLSLKSKPPNDDSVLAFHKSEAWVDENWSARYETILLKEGETVPDFTLHTADGKPFNLYHELDKGKPVLLITGSESCPVARGNLSKINGLTAAHQMDITAVMVYTIEAHPVDAVSPYSITNEIWVGKGNTKDGVLVKKPKTYRERREICSRWQTEFDLKPLVLVDNPENEFWLAYGQAPNLAYLIAPDRTVLIKQTWFKDEPLAEGIKRFNSEK